MPIVDGGEPTNETTQYVPRWHGIENPFGDIWNNVDGIIINPSSIVENNKKYSEVYVTDDPLLYSDSDYSKMKRIYMELNEKGCIKEWGLGNTAEIIPRLHGGNVTQYKCDYHNAKDGAELKTVTLCGQATDGGNAGLGDFNSSNNVSVKSNVHGFRSSCILP